jgi:murein DD-endopeptidase MepM/ murein hydrolase activator NlpD
MGYTAPADVGISSSWADHKYRNPPSVEPGTDYATAYATAIRLAGNGVVADVNHSTMGGTGRYVKINLDDGRAVRYLHLKRIACVVGQRLAQGQLFAESGASGFGSEWGYGPHVHVTLLPSPGAAFRNSLDFALYVEDEPAPTPPPPPEEEEDMTYSLIPISESQDVEIISLVTGIRAHVENVYDLSILERVKKGGTPMLRPELEIARGYLSRINPPTVAPPVTPPVEPPKA